jgi:hypothetical protein
MLKSYPKILPAVGKYGDYVVGDTVEITEKIDGSQFAFGRDGEGRLHMRSKGCAIDLDAGVQKLFKPAVDHVLSVRDRIPNNSAFYCETLATERHNTLEYGRVPRNHLALFGYTDFERTIGHDHETLRGWAETLDIEAIPLIAIRELGSLENLRDYIEQESALGKAHIEGVVVKNYRTPIEFSGQVYPFAALKYVSEAFKEKHRDNPDWKPQRDRLDELFESYRTEARWLKAVQHLRDAGRLAGEPKDIGALMKELAQDLHAEEADNFKQELFDLNKKNWTARATRGFPEFYKELLLKQNGV